MACNAASGLCRTGESTPDTVTCPARQVELQRLAFWLQHLTLLLLLLPGDCCCSADKQSGLLLRAPYLANVLQQVGHRGLTTASCRIYMRVLCVAHAGLSSVVVLCCCAQP
jgi:hypothetical protein